MLHECNHKDLNKSNNCIKNLEWVTKSENALHAVSKGKWPNLKLSSIDILNIKERHYYGETNTDIANSFNVDQSTISRIVNNLSRLEI